MARPFCVLCGLRHGAVTFLQCVMDIDTFLSVHNDMMKTGIFDNKTSTEFAVLRPNPIPKQYDTLYDRELTRSTGRNRQGERVN